MRLKRGWSVKESIEIYPFKEQSSWNWRRFRTILMELLIFKVIQQQKTLKTSINLELGNHDSTINKLGNGWICNHEYKVEMNQKHLKSQGKYIAGNCVFLDYPWPFICLFVGKLLLPGWTVRGRRAVSFVELLLAGSLELRWLWKITANYSTT